MSFEKAMFLQVLSEGPDFNTKEDATAHAVSVINQMTHIELVHRINDAIEQRIDETVKFILKR